MSSETSLRAEWCQAILIEAALLGTRMMTGVSIVILNVLLALF